MLYAPVLCFLRFPNASRCGHVWHIWHDFRGTKRGFCLQWPFRPHLPPTDIGPRLGPRAALRRPSAGLSWVRGHCTRVRGHSHGRHGCAGHLRRHLEMGSHTRQSQRSLLAHASADRIDPIRTSQNELATRWTFSYMGLRHRIALC